MQAVNVTRGRVLAADVEVAGSIWGRFMGLMLRRTLAPDHGLWLPGDNGIHMFFMRFAIDAVFLGRPDAAGDGARKVVAAKRGLRPWLGMVPFVAAANGVLELPAGTIESTGTQVGDLVQIR
ncbi:MAG TPA: DUF192 domain-containing protein [Candidatus Limnocylindrales bacterium]|nr:DUF192 domain-containing protein [Candidatus Limnocylindrales bacterium]